MIGALLTSGLLLTPGPGIPGPNLPGPNLPGLGVPAPAVQGPCSQGACTWFRETGRRLAGASPRGTLFRLRVTWWESAHPRGLAAGGQRRETVYARCSGAMPALVERGGRVWWERPLDPGEQNPAGVDRGRIALYAWACHGIRVGDGTSPALNVLYPARRSPAMREPRTLTQPEDALR